MSSFQQDLFISYSHIDNVPLSSGEQGWVSRFHGTLETLLSTRLGHGARIWRDDKLTGADVFADEIVDQFSETAVLVSVLTPRYLESEWCTREIVEFCERAREHGGLVVENKSRVIKVLKVPVDSQESLPDVVKEVLGYEFFIVEDQAPLELDPAYGDKYAQAYNRKVAKLAFDVSRLLKALQSERDQAAQAKAKATVYLAECSYDRKQSREILEAELTGLGYTVLPNRELPREEADYVTTVAGLLERCQLSVHLVGETYGGVPDGPSQKSVVQLQNELAVKQSRSGALPRLIWLPDGTRSEQAGQQAFIDSLHEDAEAQFGADLITGNLETLKAAIHASLEKLEKAQSAADEVQVPDAGTAKSLYLICDERDRKATVPIRKYLRNRGIDVAIPAFEGDAATVRAVNQQQLRSCDAVMLFYGAGDEAWKRTMDNELKKMAGYRGERPLLASYTYLTDPATGDKQDLVAMEEPDVIDGLGGVPEERLAAFVQALEARATTP